MSFVRRDTDRWRREVPGARWFKADLHVHTIDDRPGGRAKLPPGVSGSPESEATLTSYARRFLQCAAERGVRVLGITPHSPRMGSAGGASAVWRIVEEWNSGDDDDGTPFRDKVYAVFPGFEPSFKQGSRGLHLLFLFDPEVGRDRYLTAFDLAMGGVSPWRDRELQVSNKTAEEAFRELRALHDRESSAPKDSGKRWDYLTLAPHIETGKGLLSAQKGQVLQYFTHAELAGLELGDEKLPADTLKDRSWLAEGMTQHRQAFFHGSDGYSVGDIGRRHTWFKLANPRIEALRQAFIASDSRIRIAYERDTDGELNEIPNPPDVTLHTRAWLKSITVTGGASFFRGSGTNAETRFELSPDLTCIIGGSMTGKSTLLDGLRVHVEAGLPQDGVLKRQVQQRGRDGFLGGSPAVTLECPGQDPTDSPRQQWPAEFHTQSELQRLAQEPEAVEDILARLVASETGDIQWRDVHLSAMDEELVRAARHLAKLDEELADAQQALERTRKAAEELDAFSDAGIDELHRASRDVRRWREVEEFTEELTKDTGSVQGAADGFELPEIDDHLSGVLQAAKLSDLKGDLRSRWERVCDLLHSVNDDLASAKAASASITKALSAHERTIREQVDHKLAARGLDGARIREFQALNRQASLLPSYQANLGEVRDKRLAAERSFDMLLADRQDLVKEQRDAFDRVIQEIRTEFGGRISVRRIDAGRRDPLEKFLKAFRQKGITRWWNELQDSRRPSPDELLERFKARQLQWVGMSTAVEITFEECLSAAKRRELAALRCRDRYLIQLRMDDGSYRRLDDLSGGQRVSVLLSLVLETNDNRPLVIDQPEDELDNRFLFGTVLPALKRLKGRRQIVVATHNANIVVNGDADQVIHLEATASRGRVAHAGAIEEPAVRDAIVQTVDGGDEAFRLRNRKYGF